MPKRRYERREPSHDWQQIQPLLKDPAQIQYEILRPVVLWGQTPKERGQKRVSHRAPFTIVRICLTRLGWLPCCLLPHLQRFPSKVNGRCRRICGRKSWICTRNTLPFVPMNWRPSVFSNSIGNPLLPPSSSSWLLAPNHRPPNAALHAMQTSRMAQNVAEPSFGFTRMDGMLASIAGYLEVSRQTVHTTLKRWAKEQFAGIEEKSHAQASAKWISQQCKRSKSWPRIL